ncbi:PPOX class F420-dependent oxidoreductase [Nocardia stercoris]|uniref:PPOX class F420-dependent oxidoreductase n=1 Tax=Nocardia stercoris TaxID=2483361 RepID=A0A3M2LDP1_9NOCA|nr:PPOX class F420-dependent oxidoreductase [Nocardia stercoris]RMI35659.1 PPOX class F420-dependent oxidoreductase [Nocardia stercoris]
MTVEFSPELTKFIDDGKPYATLATVARDGSPHLTVIWLEREDTDLVFSTTVSRVQYKNMVRDPRVTVMLYPPDRPFAYAEVRGTVTITPDPDKVLPNRLSHKYTGLPYAEFNPASVNDAARVIVRVTPHKIVGNL